MILSRKHEAYHNNSECAAEISHLCAMLHSHYAKNVFQNVLHSSGIVMSLCPHRPELIVARLTERPRAFRFEVSSNLCGCGQV